MTIKISINIEADSALQLDHDLNNLRKILGSGKDGSAELFLTGLGSMSSEQIKSIKEVRAMTGLGLREAKDVVDAVNQGNVVSIHKGTMETASDMLEKVRGLGFNAHIKVV